MNLDTELVIQLVLLAISAGIVIEWLVRFPAAPRFTAFLLPPAQRWPVEQLWKWVEEGQPSPGFIRFFLRDPDRKIPDDRGMIAPVDGTVLADLTKDGRRFLVTSLNVWDVHVARVPCDGTIERIVDAGDIFEPSRDDPLRDEDFYFLREKSSPVQRYLELSTEYGLMRIRFVTSYLSRRIEFFCEPGAQLQRGDRVGRMLFGSTCIVELPDEIKFSVRVGERTVAGETMIFEQS